jgi:predicted O-methyltransferase YrrM
MVRDMNHVLAELLKTGVVVSESGKTHKVISQIPAQEGFFLQEIVSEVRPSVSLEVGLAYGVSALFICDALAPLPNPRHIVIDPHQFQPSSTHQSYEGMGLHNLRKAAYERLIEFHEAPSYLALPSLVSQGTKVDFAFIDGWHTFDYALTDFFYVDLLLRPGGVVVIDDTDFASVWKLCRYIVTNLAYRVVRCLPAEEAATRNPLGWLSKKSRRAFARGFWSVTHHDGLIPYSRCIAFKKVSEDSRSWDFHRNF